MWPHITADEMKRAASIYLELRSAYAAFEQFGSRPRFGAPPAI